MNHQINYCYNPASGAMLWDKNNDEAYCTYCGRKVQYNLSEEQVFAHHHGKGVVGFNGIKATCQNCGHIVDIEWVQNENMERELAAYGRQYGER